MIPSGSKKLLPVLLFAFAALTGAALFAQQTNDKTPPPAPPAPAEKSAEDKAAEAVDKIADKLDAATDKVATKLEAAMEKIADKAETTAQKSEAKASDDEGEMRALARGNDHDKEGEKPAKPDSRKKRRPRSYSAHDEEPKFGGQTVAAEKKQSEAVTIMGDTVVDGEVTDAAVSVFGNTTVNGRVHDAAVSVLGTTTVNGHVGDAAVAVLGDVVLGPDAVVDGEVVAVLGSIKRAPGSKIHGGIQEIGGFGPFQGTEWLHAYVKKCVLWGRPLWFGDNLGWAWLVAAGFLLFYLFLTLLFPRGVVRCAEMLEDRPGNTIVATLLTMLLTPLGMILLAITGVGIVVMPFLGAALFCAGLFGKAALLGWLGRRLLGRPSEESMTRDTLLAVLVGGVIVMLLYCIPVLGFVLYKTFGILGTGMVVYAFIVATRKEKPAKPAPAAPLAAHAPAMAAAAPPVVAMPMASPGFTGAAEQAASAGFIAPQPAAEGSAFTAPAAAVPPAAQPPLITADTMPRVGFWLRTAAAFLDFLLIGISCGILDNFINLEMPGFLFLGLAAYSAAMWKNKGTTIGGVICGLKVVRLDDKPIDWTIAIVRALSGFLSFFAAGVGFIWVAFDDEKQSWHDKIAGTTIVRVPKGTALL